MEAIRDRKFKKLRKYAARCGDGGGDAGGESILGRPRRRNYVAPSNSHPNDSWMIKAESLRTNRYYLCRNEGIAELKLHYAVLGNFTAYIKVVLKVWLIKNEIASCKLRFTRVVSQSNSFCENTSTPSVDWGMLEG
uniref:Uncharacterized protein n=1 Tax=Vespula pensylvanica TaxID=30213 RepID=A0A834P7Q7_VESPE|nr:hypothetical protein H0235_004660 [Vespula pensylvanica]